MESVKVVCEEDLKKYYILQFNKIYDLIEKKEEIERVKYFKYISHKLVAENVRIGLSSWWKINEENDVFTQILNHVVVTELIKINVVIEDFLKEKGIKNYKVDYDENEKAHFDNLPPLEKEVN